jgi:3-oxoacyl-[acyl-carrier-protein] synthase-1
MANQKIAVTGIGINSALGIGLEVNSVALRTGKSGVISTAEQWKPYGFKSLVSGEVALDGLRDSFDRKQLRFMCDAALLAAAATKDAIQDAGLSDAEVQSADTGIIFGTGAGASITDVLNMCNRLHKRGASKVGAYHTPIIMGSSLTANLGSVFKIHGHSYSVTSACATSSHAIMLAMDAIRSGRQNRIIVGGCEDINYLSAGCFDGMAALSTDFNDCPEKASRPLDKDRDGFVFSGGSGVLILEDFETAQARDARIHGFIAGAGATCDGDDMVVPSGEGAERAMRDAIADAGISQVDIGYLNLHGTSTPVGDLVELAAVKRVFGDGLPPYSSTKSMTGHPLGAAGSQEAIFCLLMLQGGFLAPNINLDNPEPEVDDSPVVRETQAADIQYALTNSFGFGGTNCSLVIERP